jgi:hypothetical protein
MSGDLVMGGVVEEGGDEGEAGGGVDELGEVADAGGDEGDGEDGDVLGWDVVEGVTDDTMVAGALSMSPDMAGLIISDG